MFQTTRGTIGKCLLRLAVVGAAALGWGAPEASAQSKVAIEGQGGVSIPTGRLADFLDPGPNVGLQLAYHVSPRVALNLDGNVDVMSGASLTGGAKAPDMRLWRYGGGVSADLLASERWALVTSLGVGAARFSSDEFTLPGSTESRDFGHTYVTSNAGLKLGYALSRRVTTYVGARGVWTAAKENDSRPLADLDAARLEPFGSTWSVPVTIGLNVKTGGGRPRMQAASRPTPASSSRSDPDDRERRETEARRLCEQAEAALAAGDHERAWSLYRRAQSEFPGTMCADAANVGLEKVAAVEIVRERVHFEYDRSRITNEAARVLQRKAEALRLHPDLRITIEGHCDERGSLEYNQALGLRRAAATRAYLISLGISESMFETVSYGKERPLVNEANERAWSLNRRSEFVIRNIGAL